MSRAKDPTAPGKGKTTSRGDDDGDVERTGEQHDTGAEDPPTHPVPGGAGRLVVARDIGPGTRIGDYIVHRLIASGGFGAVYHVEHAVLGRAAALKILHAEHASSRDAVTRFAREARAVNVIRHPNVVDIFDFGELAGGSPYFVMELLKGTDLETHLNTHGRLGPDEALAIFEPLCSALAAAHAKGVIHRDVKASNVFLCEQGEVRRVKLLDFGVAKLLDPDVGELSTSRLAIGTPASMAPEQIVAGEVDARTDVYALGALAFHLLTGELPFRDPSVTMMQHMHLHARRPRPSARVGVSPAIDDVVVTAMSTRPDARYPGAIEFYEALRQAVGSRTKSASPSAQLRQALAVHVDVRVDEEALEALEDGLLADMEAILPLAGSHLGTAGFLPVLETGNSLLMVVLLAEDPFIARHVREDGVRAAMRLVELLDGRSRRDPRVHVNVTMHVDTVLVAGDTIKGGDLMRLSAWVPDEPQDGLVATPVTLDGLDLKMTAIPGTPRVRVG